MGPASRSQEQDVSLTGDLGAGKTTYQGLAQGLGIKMIVSDLYHCSGV